MTSRRLVTLLIFVFAVGIFFRFYHIEFGLPHTFHADEPEIAELAIKYTYELKAIINSGEYYKLMPISYVYGMFPAYALTVATMVFSKLANLANLPFDKTTLYIFLRSVTAVMSLLIIPATVLLYKKLFSTTKYLQLGLILTAFFTALNWKLIVHAHYVNVDIIITTLLTLSYVTLAYYFAKTSDTKFTVLTGVLVGLAVGTKITVLLALPLYYFIFLRKDDLKGLLGFTLTMLIAFVLVNPFAVAFSSDFALRVFTLSVKENGLVFDSADFGLFKYIFGLTYLVTPLVIGFFAFGSYLVLKLRKVQKIDMHVFMLGMIVLYVVFFSLGTRRVDRWLLPIIPIVLMYGAYGLTQLKGFVARPVFIVMLAVTLGTYLYYPVLLLTQFSRYTPNAQAYLWMRDNVSAASNKLVVTKEGLDPMNKLDGAHVLTYNTYEAENGQFELPENPLGYNYVILASKPLAAYKNAHVKEKFPFYYYAWRDFETTVQDTANFRLLRAFKLTNPNLIEVSEIYIYENLSIPTQ